MNHLQQFNNTPGAIIHDNEVTDSDVLSGRGNGVAYREGNKFYTRLIKENQDEYQNHANGKRKKQIASGILDIINSQEPSGRFLKGKKDEAFVWVVQNEHFAMKKVTQALREKKSNKASMKEKTTTAPEEKVDTCERSSILKKRAMKNHSSKVFIESCGGEKSPEPDLITSEETKVEKIVNPDYRPMKRSVNGDSKQRFYKWMSSVSRLKLLQNSVQSIGESTNGDGLSVEEIQDAMVKLSEGGLFEEDADGSDGSNEIDGHDLNQAGSSKFMRDMSLFSMASIASNIKDDDLREAMLKLTADEEINKSLAKLNISSQDVTDKSGEKINGVVAV